MKTRQLHYPMIQFLIINNMLYCNRTAMCTESYNRGQKSLGYLRNVTNYPSFTTEVATPLPFYYNVENQVKLKLLVFNIVWGGGG